MTTSNSTVKEEWLTMAHGFSPWSSGPTDCELWRGTAQVGSRCWYKGTRLTMGQKRKEGKEEEKERVRGRGREREAQGRGRTPGPMATPSNS